VERIERVALDRAHALLRNVEGRRDLGDLLRLAAESEVPLDDDPLAVRQRVDGVIDRTHLFARDDRALGVGCRAVGDSCHVIRGGEADRRIADRATNLDPRIRAEVGAAARLVQVDRLEQAERALLHEVLQR
jgi:hypothetical protein